MNLPLGATEEDFKTCRQIISELTGAPVSKETVLNLLNIIYAKGGGYSEETLRSFAEGYLKT